MANRIAFLPTSPDYAKLFIEELVEFEWVPGMAISQGRKSVLNLHKALKDQLAVSEVLEISTRSQDPLGIALSAFNLQILVEDKLITVETVYQASKVFEEGGPYLDILHGTSMQAKQDPRLKNSGKLTSYQFENRTWPLSASPNFYDYLYIRGLLDRNQLKKIANFQAFTDLAFNQNTLKQKSGKSFNCQARSAAIAASLQQRMSESDILQFLEKSASDQITPNEQLNLFN